MRRYIKVILFLQSMQPTYHGLDELISLIDEPNRSGCQRLLNDNRTLFQQVPGAKSNHQIWPGGYYDHVRETMNVAKVLYATFNNLRPLPFELSDALLVMFLHDLEKPWKYDLGPDGELRFKEELLEKEAQHAFRERKLAEHGIQLTPTQTNGLKYVEGEHKDYSPDRRVMNELAAFCHLCDVTSARIWYDHPSSDKVDSWLGARRISD